MAYNITSTLSSIVDDTLIEMYRTEQRPRLVTLDTAALTDDTDTACDLVAGDTAAVSDVLELGDELVAVSAVSGQTLTVHRGFDGSTAVAAGHAAGTVCTVNPIWPRHRVQRAVERSIRALNAWVPLLDNVTVTVGTDRLEEVGSNTKDIEKVRIQYSEGQVSEVGGWTFHEDLPTAVSSTTKAISLPAILEENDVIYVTRQVPFQWTDVSAGGFTQSPDPADTVTLPEDGADLPSLYAAAYLLLGHEVSRDQLATVEEWSQEAAVRNGVNLRMVNTRWQTFYRRVDEVRRTVKLNRNRPYRPMTRA